MMAHHHSVGRPAPSRREGGVESLKSVSYGPAGAQKKPGREFRKHFFSGAPATDCRGEAEPVQADVFRREFLVGKRAIMAALGLNRSDTDWLIEAGAIPTLLIAGLRSARRADIEEWQHAQRELHVWADDGGPAIPVAPRIPRGRSTATENQETMK